jgi:hypothetical protein
LTYKACHTSSPSTVKSTQTEAAPVDQPPVAPAAPEQTAPPTDQVPVAPTDKTAPANEQDGNFDGMFNEDGSLK